MFKIKADLTFLVQKFAFTVRLLSNHLVPNASFYEDWLYKRVASILVIDDVVI